MTEVQRPRQWPFLMAEAALVVLSILLAFAIDASWDRRQEVASRTELLRAIRADFAATDQSLDGAVEEAARLIARTGGYLEAVVEELPLPRDSLVYLLRGTSGFAFHEPSLASYRNAVGTGNVNSIRDPELLSAFTDFELAERHYEQHRALIGEMYYLGAVHDLRRAAGGFLGPFVERDWGEPSRREDWGTPRVLVPQSFDLRGKEGVAAA
jgi:hypothetical protein